MMQTEDKIEKMVPSAEEKEKEEEEEVEEEEEEEEEDEDEDDARDEDDDDDEVQEGRGDKETEGEATPQTAETTEKDIPLTVQPDVKKQAEGLNLNNEVVKMRKEVKRVRALIIRKLTRQIASLKKKKGTETAIERNQRRAARLLEEIHAMKNLSPDLVTKTALRKNLNFEQECKNPKSTISDRAVARIATHPQFNKKIDGIKAAVKAFKEERMKGGKQQGREDMQKKAGKVTPQSPDKKGQRKSEKEGEDITVEQKEIIDSREGDDILKDTDDATVAKPLKKPGKASHSADISDGQRKEIPDPTSVKPAPIKSSQVQVKNEPQSKDVEKKSDLKPAPEVLQEKKDEEESDFESSDDEEKEYFDDSTEERFHKQSSQSEESDEDDFFVGKVSKYKKKKKKSVEGETSGKGHEVKADPTDQVQSSLDELESRLKSKAPPLSSVFYSSLSASKPGGGRGAGRGRGGDTFRGRGKPKGGSGPNRDFSKHSKFQEKGAERNSGSNHSRHPQLSEKRGFPSGGRGRGRGRGDNFRQNDHRGGGAFSPQASQQALHPSWEASRKRKEQQGQILAFQGKKIKFDDDD